MGIIKAANTNSVPARGFRDLGDLERHAATVVERARAEARRIVDEAQAEAGRLAAEAEPRGFEAGRQRGLAEGREAGRRAAREEAIGEFREELQRLIGAWSEALRRFESGLDELLLAAREDVLGFAVAMGARITRRIVETDPAVVGDQLEEALRLVVAGHALSVRINPQDRDRLGQVLGPLLERVGGSARAELVDDPDVGAGGCIVETGRGRVDATIERQIGRIAEALLPARAQTEPETGS